MRFHLLIVRSEKNVIPACDAYFYFLKLVEFVLLFIYISLTVIYAVVIAFKLCGFYTKENHHILMNI